MDPLYLESADGFRRCPYNPTHTVASLRFIGHLMKCSKTSGKKFQVCPWNAQHHIVSPADYNEHVNTCTFRTYVDTTLPRSSFDLIDHLNCPAENVVTGNEEIYHESSWKPQPTPVTKSGIYGDMEDVHMGIGAIVDAFSESTFSKSANGLVILQKLVETIYEEARIQAQ